MIFNREETKAWLEFANKRRESGTPTPNSMEAFIEGYRFAKLEASRTLGWEVIVEGEDGYADVQFMLDVGFENKTCEDAVAHVRSVCGIHNPNITSCARKYYAKH